MKERPIAFSASMVRALLAGRKTQTRRIAKLQPCEGGIMRNLSQGIAARQTSIASPGSVGEHGIMPWGDARWEDAFCHLGQPGDRLWIREEHHITLRDARAVRVRYSDGSVADEVTIGPREHALFLGRKRPAAVTRARFMWRCLSRITLDITSVRIERLNDISEADAIAEGIESVPGTYSGQTFWKNYGMGNYLGYFTPIDSYRTLWESINGPGSWALNPWVWVISFRRVA